MLVAAVILACLERVLKEEGLDSVIGVDIHRCLIAMLQLLLVEIECSPELTKLLVFEDRNGIALLASLLHLDILPFVVLQR